MSEQSASTPIKEVKPWYKQWWGLLICVLFLPFTLSVLILKQKWSPIVKGIALLFLWVIVIGAGSGSKTTTVASESAQASPSPTPQTSPKPEITLEQKQADFTKFYIEYKSQAQAVLLVQASLASLAEVSKSEAELYLALGKLSEMQKQLSANDIDVPESLKDYKDLGGAAFQTRTAASHFEKAINAMKEYVNKKDLKKLEEAKNRQQLGEENLSQSLDKVEAVAKELGVDTTTLK